MEAGNKLNVGRMHIRCENLFLIWQVQVDVMIQGKYCYHSLGTIRIVKHHIELEPTEAKRIH